MPVLACGLALRAWDSLEVVAEVLRTRELQARAGDLFRLGPGYYGRRRRSAAAVRCGTPSQATGPGRPGLGDSTTSTVDSEWFVVTVQA